MESPKHDGPQQPESKEPEARPRYEPPRITKKRSVSRATLFSGGGVPSTGITGSPP